MKHLPLSLKQRLRASGFRATKPRLALAEFLHGAHRPVGTPELSERFVPSVFDLATLYRTLKSFETTGLVRRVPIDQRFATYEWADDEHDHHHHLVCTQCGAIEEMPDCDLDRFEKRVLGRSKHFTSITSHSLEFFGLCRGCTGASEARTKSSPRS